jgi:hypothetical protein
VSHPGGRDAVIWAAKHSPAVAIHLTVPTKKKPPEPPPVAPYRRGQGPVKTWGLAPGSRDLIVPKYVPPLPSKNVNDAELPGKGANTG